MATPRLLLLCVAALWTSVSARSAGVPRAPLLDAPSASADRPAPLPRLLSAARGGGGARGGAELAVRSPPRASAPVEGGHGLDFRGAPWFVLKCAYFSALDAMLLGYDIGVISGVLVFIRDRFELSTHQTELFASAINSAAIFGSLGAGWLSDQCGRKSTLFLSSTFFTLGSAVMACAASFRVLLLGRLLQGIGIGAGLLVAPMFISELSPPQYRGSLVTLSEVSLSLGILLAYVANYALAGFPAQWRLMLGLGVLPGVLLTLRIFFLPESPRWLLSKGRVAQARETLGLTLGGRCSTRELSAAVRTIRRRLDAESSAARGGMLALFRKGPARTATVVGVVLAVCQHAVGIESIIYYSPLIFERAGVRSKQTAILGTVGMGLVKLVCETYSLLNVDRIGRRPLLLTGGVGLTLSLLLIAASLRARTLALGAAAATAGVSAHSVGTFVGLGLYMAFHALSFGPITWLVLSEIFPASLRGRAMGLATTANRATSFLCAVTFLSLCEALHWSGAFALYATLAAGATVFYAMCVPETTGLRLEEVFPLFGRFDALVAANADSVRGRGPPAGADMTLLLKARRVARAARAAAQ